MQRTSRVSLIAIAVAAAGGAAAAVAPFFGCMGEGTTCPPLILAVDAGLDAAKEAGPGVAGVRLAHLSPTAPNIDFCLAPLETGVFQGPLLAQYAAALLSQGTTPGGSNLYYPQASAYMVVKPDTYTARIVVAGATDCTAGILRDDVPVPSLSGGGFATVALLGEVEPTASLQAMALLDDGTQPAPDSGAKLYMRFLHAAPNQPEMQVTLSAKPLFDLAFGETSSADAAAPDATVRVDKNGYLVSSAVSNGRCAIGPAADAASPPLATGAINGATGGVLTVALVGDTLPNDAGTGSPFALFECVDNAATTGVLGTCMVLEGGL
jgi:Domain of unknown function (DUF4397)